MDDVTIVAIPCTLDHAIIETSSRLADAITPELIIWSIESVRDNQGLGSSGRSIPTSFREKAASNNVGLLTAKFTYARPIVSNRSTDRRFVLLPAIRDEAPFIA